jgi:hypothetical protein
MTMSRAPWAVLLLALACRPTTPAELPVCPPLSTAARAAEADTRLLPPAVWFQVLIPGVSRPDLRLPPEPRACSGAPITPDPDATPLPPRPLAESDLTFGEGPEGQLLVWARALRLADGSALGPVALVRWHERGLDIRAIGPLRGPARRVRLRLEPLGEHSLLVADGERCPAPDRCVREYSLLPLIGRRFTRAELTEGEHTGPARVLAGDRRVTPLSGGWIRRAEVQRNLRVESSRAVIRESIRVRDCDAGATPEVCHDQLHARDERPLRLDDGRLVTNASAWTLMTGAPHE